MIGETSTNQKIKKQIEDGSDALEKIKSLEKQNMHLVGESTILRQNLIALEKENYELKEIQNNKHVIEFRKSEEIKKELKVLQIENRIKENQLKAFKKQKNIIIEDLKPSWIFNRINSEVKFSLYPFEYSRLKILHDYFYDEFEKLLSDKNIINEVCKYRNNFRKFYKCFMLFSDKKELFDELFMTLLVDYFEYPNEKNTLYLYKVLTNCELAWILNFIDKENFMIMINNFLDSTVHVSTSILFYFKLAKQRPFLLSVFLPISRFNFLIHCKHNWINFLLHALDDKALEKYVSEETIDLIDPVYLKRIFKDDYFETKIS